MSLGGIRTAAAENVRSNCKRVRILDPLQLFAHVQRKSVCLPKANALRRKSAWERCRVASCSASSIAFFSPAVSHQVPRYCL